MRTGSFVWEALQDARRANLAEAGDAAPVAGGEGITRRSVLAALAAAGASAMLPRPGHARVGGSGPVVVIGGGIAGLAALWHLTRAGVDARLYEARTRLGGRIYTERTPGQPVFEVGAQLVNSDHADMHALAREFGVALVDRKAGPHRTMILAGTQEISRERLVSGLRGIAGQIDSDSRRLDRDYARVAAELDRMSFSGYLDKHARLIPEPWVRELMEATARTEYGVEPAQASAIQLVFNLPTVQGRSIEVLSRSDERYLIAGGSSTLVEAMGKRMAGRITTYRRATRIDSNPGGGARVTFSNGATIDAAAVIVTTPASIMSRIEYGVPLPPLWRRFIAEVGLGRVGKVQAMMTARPWEGVFGRGGELWQTDHAAGASLGWDGAVRGAGGANAAGIAAAGSIWTWFTGGVETTAADFGTARDQALRFARLAERSVPGMAAATGRIVRRTQWHKEPFTAGGYVNYRPGQLTRFAELIWTEANGVASSPLSASPIWFAGEHLSDAFPGYMNGGAQTGRLAAQAIVAARAPARRV